MKLLIPAATGVEASVKRQLVSLGYGDCPANNGRISLFGTWEDVARLNVNLRAGERVLIELSSFPARTFDELFEGVFLCSWEEYLTPHARIEMDGKSFKSTLGAIKAAGGVAKKAILKRLGERLGAAAFDEKGERAVVGVSIFEDVATVTLDTSGDGLHKRGYRTLAYDAPLKETTAAAILELSHYRAERTLADLFCGSGTLPIEAALIAQNIAPNAGRDFDFTKWKCAPKVLARAREEALSARRQEKPEIFASDISERAVSIARYHARRAGVEGLIRFSVMDMREFTCGERGGVLVSNPPYGERLEKGSDLLPLYRDYSRVFHRLDGWGCNFLTSFEGAERAFSRAADKKRRLYNANIACTLYSYLPKGGRTPRK